MRLAVFVVFLYTLGSNCWPFDEYGGEWNYNRNEPRIKAFYPKGLKIVLHIPKGPSSIKFVGTIYRDSENIPIEGVFVFNEVQRKRRRWVFNDPKVELKVGDILNYEIFEEGYGGSRYKTYDGNAEIYELLDYNKCFMHRCRPSNVPPSEVLGRGAVTVPITDKPTTPEPVDFKLLDTKLKSCQQSIINTTNDLLELQSKVIRLEAKNQILTNILSQSRDAKKLTISGVIPQSGSPSETVNFIIWEKLDIKPHIVSANRENATTIVFEVETIDEKLDILGEAEDRLTSARFLLMHASDIFKKSDRVNNNVPQPIESKSLTSDKSTIDLQTRYSDVELEKNKHTYWIWNKK